MRRGKDLFRPKEYVKPSSVAEAIKLLVHYGEKARLIAGGTDLLVEKDPQIEVIIDVAGLGLNYIKTDSRGIKIGAATTFAAIEASPALGKSPYGILGEAAHLMGTPQIRNVATIGGNICSAVPSADSPPALLALAATLVIAGPTGERTMNIADFFLDARKNALNRGELVAEIQLPTLPARMVATFVKKGRLAAADLAVVNGAVSLIRTTGGLCEDVRIALGAVAPIPLRTKKAEAMLQGKKPNEDLLRKVADCAASEIKPISDVRGSAEYRRALSRVLVERMLMDVVASVSG
jgi:carbon-monoxide dehydrogenase medium subunit